MAINALHLHFNEWPFVDSSGQNKTVTNNGVSIKPGGSPQEILYINGSGTNVYGSYYTGQSFLATDNWSITSVYIDSIRTITAGPFNAYCSIYLDGGSGPVGSALGTSSPVSVNNVLTPYTFTFNCPVELISGNTYWVVLDVSGSDAIWFVRTDTSIYADGSVGYSSTGPTTNWNIDTGYDCKQFKLNGFTTPASGSGCFDGSSDLQVSRANVLTPVIENWEVDFIIDHSSLTGTQTYYSQYEDSDNRCHLQHINGSGLEFLFRYGGVDLISLTGSEITDSNEHHIALTKEGDTFRLFLDGVLEDSDTYSFGNELIDSDIFIGQDGNSANYLIASMRNFRISNITRFKNIFSPDYSYDIDTDENTQLLSTLFLSAGDKAEAGLPIWNPRQVTRGNVDTGLRVYRFGNQCGYFSGSQDGFAPYSLQVPDHPNWYIADKDFTLDTWLYPLSHFNWAGIMHQNTRWYWYIDAAGKLNWYVEDGASTFSMQSSGTVPIDEWSHCALTRWTTSLSPSGELLHINGSGNDLYANPYIAQSITPIGTWKIDRVFCNHAIWSSTGYGKVEIRPDDSGQPGKNNTVLATSDVQNIGTIEAPNNFYFSSPISLASGVMVWLVFVSTDSGGNPSGTINFRRTGASVYSGGYIAAGVTGNDTPWGVNTTFDMRQLKLYGLSENVQSWKMYIKGIKQAETLQTFTIPNLTGPMWIGRGTSTSDLYHGYMDELRLLLNKAVWTEDEFWPFDYPYFSEAIIHRYRNIIRRRIHAIQGR